MNSHVVKQQVVARESFADFSYSDVLSSAMSKFLREQAFLLMNEHYDVASYVFVRYVVLELIDRVKWLVEEYKTRIQELNDMLYFGGKKVVLEVDVLAKKKSTKIPKQMRMSLDALKIVETYAKTKGCNLTEALHDIIYEFSKRGVDHKIEAIHNEVLIAVIKAYMKELDGLIFARKELEKVLHSLHGKLKELMYEQTVEQILAKLDLLFDFLERNGMDIEAISVEYADTIDELDHYFRKTLGKPFDVREFAEKCWLADKSPEEWLEELFSDVGDTNGTSPN